MRLVWTTDNADHFRIFCGFLQAKSITITTEEQVLNDWASDQYGTRKYLLWISDEDQVDACTHWLAKFIENPSSPQFITNDVATTGNKNSATVTQHLEQHLRRPITPKAKEIKKGVSTYVTLTSILIFLCSIIYLYELYSEKRTQAAHPEMKQEQVGPSAIRKALLFDYPPAYELLDKIVLLYGVDSLNNPQDLPEAGKFLYKKYLEEPSFAGYYPYLLSFAKNTQGEASNKNPPLSEITLFSKIRQGEIWRLFTPALLHVGILHIFFNMVWLLMLGTQIEERIGPLRFLVLVLISGVFSNVGQYLMSGPNFAGFSGVICAMATYIRARQQVSPWEAYEMSSSTFAFIMFFIGVLALLSLVTFFLNVFVNVSLPFAMANTAHLVGAITGYCLGRLRFFSWQLHN